MRITYPEVRSPLALQGMMSIIRGLPGGPKSQRFGTFALGDAASLLGIWKTCLEGPGMGVAAAFAFADAASRRPCFGRRGGLVMPSENVRGLGLGLAAAFAFGDAASWCRGL